MKSDLDLIQDEMVRLRVEREMNLHIREDGIIDYETRVTPEGEIMGGIAAGLCSAGQRIAAEKFPDHEQPCHDCAFRRMTLPNGDQLTQWEVALCVATATPFYCHIREARPRPTQLCAGWALAMLDEKGVRKMSAALAEAIREVREVK